MVSMILYFIIGLIAFSVFYTLICHWFHISRDTLSFMNGFRIESRTYDKDTNKD